MGSVWSGDDLDVNSVPIVTYEDALNAFTWVVKHYYSFDRDTRLERSAILDSRLAEWSKSHPGEFIRLFTNNDVINAWKATLVAPPDGVENWTDASVAELFLMCFPSIPRKGTNNFPQLQELYDAISVEGFVPVLLNLARNHRGEAFRGDILQWIRIVRDMGAEIFDAEPIKGVLPPEARDSLLYISKKEPLPNLLPSEQTLAHLTPIQVEEILCQYTLETIDEIHERLRPGNETSAGYIGAYERLAPVIIYDAKQLLKHNVHRDSIADMLELLIAYEATAAYQHNKEIDQDRWSVVWKRFQFWMETTGYDPAGKMVVLGLQRRDYHSDPFHPTFDNPTVDTSVEYWAIRSEHAPEGAEKLDPETEWPADKTIHFTQIHPSLIRRACFFEGPGSKYRLDPNRCVEMFELTPALD